MNRWHILPLFLLALAGCAKGPSEVTLTGTLQHNGRPVTLADEDTLTITFLALAEDGRSYGADFDAEAGTFVVLGPSPGQGIPPGRYRIAVTGSNGDTDQDRFREAFSEEHTPLQYEVTDAPEQAVVIDLGARTVTRR